MSVEIAQQVVGGAAARIITPTRPPRPALPDHDVRRERMPFQFRIKRVVDVVATGLGLLLISPLLGVIAIAIKLESRGPVLFSQIRAGVGGKPFRMYKFRTMVANADQMKRQLQHLNESGDPRLFKIKNDPRITRVGRILRKTSLDELNRPGFAGDSNL